MEAICVFCGSSPGALTEYADVARRLGRELVRRKLELVYGGGRVGLMGAIADAVLDAGGRVMGVIPEALERREVAHTGVTDLRVVASMHERKALMADLSDGFVAMPGGLGTLDEMFEILTWAQLGIHAKPCGFLNVAGYFDRLFAFLDDAVAQRFLSLEHRKLMLVDTSPEALLDRFAAYVPTATDKWVDRDQR